MKPQTRMTLVCSRISRPGGCEIEKTLATNANELARTLPPSPRKAKSLIYKSQIDAAEKA